MNSEFVLFLAGEDSGDILGEQAVLAAKHAGFTAKGIGGNRMQNAGLLPLENFEKLPVSGFSDILFKLFFFLTLQKKIKREIQKKECKAVYFIDYPGFNLKLLSYAKKKNKKVYYLAPPQIYAWKQSRIKYFSGNITCGFLFPFEMQLYKEKNVLCEHVAHPFLKSVKLYFQQTNLAKNESNRILLFPGSRKNTLLRNLELYKYLASYLQEQTSFEIIFVASRTTLFQLLKENLNDRFKIINKEIITENKASVLKNVKLVITNPGTVTLESALAHVPFFCIAKPDPWTFVLAKIFLKIKHLSLPNLILEKEIFPEFIYSPFLRKKEQKKKIINILNEMLTKNYSEHFHSVENKIKTETSIYQSAFEFFT